MVVELLGDASEVRDNVELERSLIAPHTHTLPPPPCQTFAWLTLVSCLLLSCFESRRQKMTKASDDGGLLRCPPTPVSVKGCSRASFLHFKTVAPTPPPRPLRPRFLVKS